MGIMGGGPPLILLLCLRLKGAPPFNLRINLIKEISPLGRIFKKATKHIYNPAKGGAYSYINHRFMVKDAKHEHVDIEFITGKAFVE